MKILKLEFFLRVYLYVTIYNTWSLYDTIHIRDFHHVFCIRVLPILYRHNLFYTIFHTHFTREIFLQQRAKNVFDSFKCFIAIPFWMKTIFTMTMFASNLYIPLHERRNIETNG